MDVTEIMKEIAKIFPKKTQYKTPPNIEDFPSFEAFKEAGLKHINEVINGVTKKFSFVDDRLRTWIVVDEDNSVMEEVLFVPYKEKEENYVDAYRFAKYVSENMEIIKTEPVATKISYFGKDNKRITYFMTATNNGQPKLEVFDHPISGSRFLIEKRGLKAISRC